MVADKAIGAVAIFSRAVIKVATNLFADSADTMEAGRAVSVVITRAARRRGGVISTEGVDVINFQVVTSRR